MNQDGLARASFVLRASVPALVAVMVVIFTSLPFAVPGISAGGVAFAACTVFYWALFRPEAMPPGAAFAIGLVQDLIGGGPIGAMALTLLALSMIVEAQRRAFAGKSLMLIWFGFILIALPVSLLFWLVLCLYQVALLDPRPVLAGYVLAVAMYPLVSEFHTLLRSRLLRL